MTLNSFLHIYSFHTLRQQSEKYSINKSKGAFKQTSFLHARIQYFAKGAASEVKNWQCDEVQLHEENKLFVDGIKGPLKDPRSFGVSVFKYIHSPTF